MNCLRFQQIAMKVVTAIAILLVAAAQAHHKRCPKWKRQCENYEHHNCSHQVWKSCCIPSTGTEGSGFENEMVKYPSGIYSIQTGAFSKSEVWCDMDTAGGGWLTILRRTKDNTNETFKRFAEDYLSGFGDLNGDFWLGLRTMQVLTKTGDWEMRVDLHDNSQNHNSTYAQYSSFKVDDMPSCKLHLGQFSASADYLFDSLEQFDKQDFVVLRDEHDGDPRRHCAIGRGGWWYIEKTCSHLGSVLTKSADSLEWWVRDANGAPTEVNYDRYEMKIRPKNCLSGSVDTGNQ